MPELLNESQCDLRDRTKTLASSVLPPILANESLNAEQRRDAIATASKTAGIFYLTQPKEYGGLEGTLMDFTIVHDTLGSENLCHIGGIFGPSPGVLDGVDEPLKSQYLLPMLAGEKTAAFGFTEPDGTDRATWGAIDNDIVRITGQKSYVTGGASADFINTLVEIEGHGPAMVVIDRTAPGVEIKNVFGSVDGSHHAYLQFNAVEVPLAHVIGEPGEGLPRALRQIGNTRLIFAAQSVGLSRWTIGFVTDHIQAPHRSGQPLGSHEGVRLRYADMRIEAFAARSMVYRTARLGDSGANVVNEVIASKVFATEAVGRIVDWAIQLVGGRALRAGHPLSELQQRVRAWRIAEGASDVLRLNLARGRLDLNFGTL